MSEDLGFRDERVVDERKPTSIECSLFSSPEVNTINGKPELGWLVGVSDFQRNLRFGSKLADRRVELRKNTDFLSVLSFMFSRL